MRQGLRLNNKRSVSKLMSTQSSSDVNPPTALATLYLEDGSSFTAKSFGCHESVEGEVSAIELRRTRLIIVCRIYILHEL